ncbi:MAG: hypothetical protein N4A38_01960 [Candidatus Gracilibacteria bacterium]|nr:hypothetical protein [Candidatus Gracilibacteria bacterium]
MQRNNTLIYSLNIISFVINFFYIFAFFLIIGLSFGFSNGLSSVVIPICIGASSPLTFLFCLFGSLLEEDNDTAVFLASFPILFFVFSIFIQIFIVNFY